MKQQGEGKGTGPREAVSGVGLPREDGEVGQGEEGRKDSLLLTPPPPKAATWSAGTPACEGFLLF